MRGSEGREPNGITIIARKRVYVNTHGGINVKLGTNLQNCCKFALTLQQHFSLWPASLAHSTSLTAILALEAFIGADESWGYY